MKAVKKNCFCFAESRRSGEVGLRLAIASLQRRHPGAAVLAFLADPSDSLLRWLERYPAVQVRRDRWPEEDGWNCKPAVLLAALDAGADEAVWLDDDLIVSGDLLGRLATLDDDTLVAAEETRDAPHQGTVWRARAWRLAPGREFGCAINSCVLRVTERHRELLQRWRELLGRPDYRAWQRRPRAERPPEMFSDQDSLSALLGSAEMAGARVQLLRSGRDIVHGGWLRYFNLRERLARLGSREALLIHGIDDKPWQVLDVDQPGFGLWFFTLLQLECSAYVTHARTLRAEIGESYPWLERRSWPARVLNAAGGGHDALRAWPLVLGRAIARACGFNYLARRLGLAARIS